MIILLCVVCLDLLQFHVVEWKPCHEQNPRNCSSFCGYNPLDVGHSKLKFAPIYGIELEEL